MVDDVTVGEVTEVDRVGWHARVTLRIRDDVELPDNAIADIRQVSLLGEKYVALEPPADAEPTGTLSDGDNIALADTGRNPEVEEVLGALSFLLSGGGVGQLGTITHELNEVMDGRTDRLRHLLGSLEDVVGTLDDQKGDIIRAMEAIDRPHRDPERREGHDHRRARRRPARRSRCSRPSTTSWSRCSARSTSWAGSAPG